MYQEWPLDPTLTRAVCLNFPSFPTILLNLRYPPFSELHPNSRHQLCPPSTLGHQKSSKISISLTTTRSQTSLSEGEDIVGEASSRRLLLKRMPSESANMTEQRQHIRYQVEFPATFAGDHAGIGIVYNLGMGGCKVASDLAVQSGALLVVILKVPEQTSAITVRTATVQWTLEREFGVEFLEMQESERARLEQFLATQVNIVP